MGAGLCLIPALRESDTAAMTPGSPLRAALLPALSAAALARFHQPTPSRNGGALTLAAAPPAPPVPAVTAAVTSVSSVTATAATAAVASAASATATMHSDDVSPAVLAAPCQMLPPPRGRGSPVPSAGVALRGQKDPGGASGDVAAAAVLCLRLLGHRACGTQRKTRCLWGVPRQGRGDTGQRASAVPGCHRCPFVPAGCLEHAGQQAVLLLQDDVSVGALREVLGGIQQGEEREGHAQTPRCHLCATTLRVRP